MKSVRFLTLNLNIEGGRLRKHIILNHSAKKRVLLDLEKFRFNSSAISAEYTYRNMGIGWNDCEKVGDNCKYALVKNELEVLFVSEINEEVLKNFGSEYCFIIDIEELSYYKGDNKWKKI